MHRDFRSLRGPKWYVVGLTEVAGLCMSWPAALGYLYKRISVRVHVVYILHDQYQVQYIEAYKT